MRVPGDGQGTFIDGSGSCAGSFFIAQLLHLIEQGLLVDLQESCGVLSVPASGVESCQNRFDFSLLFGLGHLVENGRLFDWLGFGHARSCIELMGIAAATKDFRFDLASNSRGITSGL